MNGRSVTHFQAQIEIINSIIGCCCKIKPPAKLFTDTKVYYLLDKRQSRREVTMFEMGKIGRRIADLRKQRDMTQMELADRLNISFQAVSAWERGQSMPDISKLTELSEIFNATIDDILGNERSAKVLKAIQAEQPLNTPLQAAELEEIAPVLKPHQMDRVVREQRGSIDLKELNAVLPFISTQLLTELAAECYKEGDLDELVRLAPFMDEDALDDLINEMVKDGKDFGDLSTFFPFVSEKRLSQWAEEKYKESGDLKSIESALPFLDEEVIDRLAANAYGQNGLHALADIAPFLNEETLNELAKKTLLKDGLAGISPILPFIDEKIIEDFIRQKKPHIRREE
jgi:transcriptional regulator with XRE-family HTH domain